MGLWGGTSVDTWLMYRLKFSYGATGDFILTC